MRIELKNMKLFRATIQRGSAQNLSISDDGSSSRKFFYILKYTSFVLALNHLNLRQFLNKRYHHQNIQAETNICL